MKLIYWIGLALTTWKLSLANKKIDELTIEKEEIAKKALDLAIAQKSVNDSSATIKSPDVAFVAVK